MKTNEIIFRTTRVTFGLAHLITQSLADGVIELEAQIVKRTGVLNDKGEMISLDEDSLAIYKKNARLLTKQVQQNAIGRMKRLHSKYKPLSEV